jgi:Transposase IS66 family
VGWGGAKTRRVGRMGRLSANFVKNSEVWLLRTSRRAEYRALSPLFQCGIEFGIVGLVVFWIGVTVVLHSIIVAAISPVALVAVKRIDALFDIERDINGLSAEEGLRVRQEQSAPLLAALEAWLREEHSRLSRSASVAQPIDYMLKRWDRFARFIEDGRVCLTNNAAERALRGFALGRKSWLFAGSERGADRAAAMAMIMTAKLNDVGSTSMAGRRARSHRRYAAEPDC